MARNAGSSSSSGYGLRMESVGIYEYSTKDLIGHGAFAVVYRGRLKMVSEKDMISCLETVCLPGSKLFLGISGNWGVKEPDAGSCMA